MFPRCDGSKEKPHALQGPVIFQPGLRWFSMYTPPCWNSRTRIENILRICGKNHAEMKTSAEAEYPEECCGLLFAGREETEVVSMPNLQNELHQQDPERFQRDARRAYYMDVQEMQRTCDEKKSGGLLLAAIYHSHPEEKAYFSATDSEAAAPFGTPNLPGVVYLVYSVIGGKVADLKAFDWEEEEECYAEIPLEIEDA